MPLTVSTRQLLLATLSTVAAMAMQPARAATLSVTTVADASPPITDGQCSLREALINASNDAATYSDCPAGTGNDVITFAVPLFTAANQYTATVNLAGRLVAGTPAGTPHALTIRPPLPSGGNVFRVRLVASTGLPYALMDVLPTAAPFVLERSSIEGGRGFNAGGGVRLLSHHAEFVGVHFIDNQARSGGALTQLRGNGVLSVRDSLFQGNRATDGSGGALELEAVEAGHRISIIDTAFIGNQASDKGGALDLSVAADISGADTPVLDISHSRFVGNSSIGVGGGINIRADSNVSQRLRLRLTDSLFEGNLSEASGGALSVRAFRDSPGSVDIRRSSFIDNLTEGPDGAGGGGGGILARDVDLHIENSLFARNHAGVTGGGIIFGASDGSLPRRLSLIGNSFRHHTYSPGAPGRTLYLLIPTGSSGWTWTFAGNLFDPAPGTPVSECVIQGGSPDVLTRVGGYNLSPEASCRFLGTADIQAAPMVMPSDSGNPLKPMLLLPQPGSPAIDAWPAGACTDHLGQPLTEDLVDASRPADGDASGVADCDIGAFELPDPSMADFIFTDGFE